MLLTSEISSDIPSKAETQNEFSLVLYRFFFFVSADTDTNTDVNFVCTRTVHGNGIVS